MRRINRRSFIGNTAAGVGAIIAGFTTLREPRRSTTDGASSDAPAASQSRPDPALARLVAPFAVGGPVGALTLEAIDTRRANTGALILSDAAGRRVRVDVCGRDDGTPGIATTEYYGLYLCNGGKGDTPTDEASGLAVMTLAEAIRRNEGAGAPLALATKRQSWAVA